MRAHWIIESVLAAILAMGTGTIARAQVAESAGVVAEYVGKAILKECLLDPLWDAATGKVEDLDAIRQRLESLERNVAYREEMREEIRTLRRELDDRVTRDEFRQRVLVVQERFRAIEARLDAIEENDVRQDARLEDAEKGTKKADQADTYTMMAQRALFDEKPWRALACCRIALKMNPKAVLSHKFQAEAYLALGMTGPAVESATQELVNEGESKFTLDFRGEAYRLNGQFEEAIRDFSHALELDADEQTYTTEILMHRAKAHLARGSLDEALADCDAALERNQRNGELPELRARVRIARREFDGAVEDANRAVDLNGSDPSPYCVRAEALLGQWMARPATIADGQGAGPIVADCRAAAARDPKLARPHVIEGRCLLWANQPSGAIASLDAAIERDPFLAEAYALRAEAYRGRNDRDRGDRVAAIRDATQAIRLDSGLAAAYTTRGLTYGIEGAEIVIADFMSAEQKRVLEERRGAQFVLAFRDINTAVRLDPTSPAGLKARMMAYIYRGHPGDLELAKADEDEAKRLEAAK